MKSLISYSEICDLTKPEKEINFSQNVEEQMSRVRIYRDENGGLIANTPYSWGEIKEKVQHGDLQFGRDVQTTRLYRDKMSSLSKEWASIDDYCMCAFLGYEVATSQMNGQTRKCADTSKSLKDSGGLSIAKNDFPYYLLPDVQHFVLWAVDRFHESCYQTFVEEHFPSDRYNVVMFENLKVNKSVKSVHHLHVLIRDNSTVHTQTSIDTLSLRPKM